MKPATPHNAVKGRKGFISIPLAKRLERSTCKTDEKGCWFWTASKNEHGYGQIWEGTKLRSAHVVAWELANGKSAKGKIIGHSCETRDCVNPAHLEAVTASENAQWHRKRTLKLLDDRKRLVEALRLTVEALDMARDYDFTDARERSKQACALLRELGEDHV